MEYAVYRIFRDEEGSKMGSFVDMFSSREEAEDLSGRLGEEHEVVGLWTREIAEEDNYRTIVFLPNGIVAPEPGATETEE